MTADISTDELWTRIRASSLVVVEALGPDYYRTGHLPSAHNITLRTSDDEIRATLPALDEPIVVYGSAGSGAAQQVKARLHALGYMDVRIYPGGKELWAESGLPLESLTDPPS